jgi:hypothetical protein
VASRKLTPIDGADGADALQRIGQQLFAASPSAAYW